MKSVAFVTSLVLVVGCSDSSSSTSSSSGSSSGGNSSGSSSSGSGASPDAGTVRGKTACGKGIDGTAEFCQAGQYCADPVLRRCESGCLNDDNCAANQACQKGADNGPGTCVNVTSCNDICAKAKVCEPNVDVAQCVTVCTGFSEPCKSCLAQSTCATPADACDKSCK